MGGHSAIDNHVTVVVGAYVRNEAKASQMNAHLIPLSEIFTNCYPLQSTVFITSLKGLAKYQRHKTVGSIRKILGGTEKDRRYKDNNVRNIGVIKAADYI